MPPTADSPLDPHGHGTTEQVFDNGQVTDMTTTTRRRTAYNTKPSTVRPSAAEPCRDDARDQLILDNLGYVKHILGKLLHQLPRGVDAENLESAGVLGLIEAASQYDPSRNVEFRTFSYRRIRGAILDELRRNCPLSQQMLQKITILRQLRSQFQGAVSVEQLADASGMSIREVNDCIQGFRLTRPDSWSDAVRVSGHVGDNDNSGELETAEMQQVLADGIESLPDKMRIAIALHYNEGLKLKEVGDVLNLSESRVSRMLDAARTRLQEYAQRRGY
ncbi:MAG TPA: sigma-70 family RNA polymerase sigma factor [Planctomycetes bacterium]|nr:sigma-70 family RNA polymerase sigma factor [Fuerstiella sp.]HIK92048.1 sigma-70 family RNA polymerase sigma factor [Planctomycetota bacterium]